MKKLEKEFTKKGFIYKQLKRLGNKAIYTQKKDDTQSTRVHYEVIIIKSHDGYEIAGNKIPAGEVYPSSAQWGAAGWTYVDLQDAENKFKKLKE
jgi:hypothetical protein